MFSNTKKNNLLSNNEKVICLRIIYLLVINGNRESVCVNFSPAYNDIFKLAKHPPSAGSPSSSGEAAPTVKYIFSPIYFFSAAVKEKIIIIRGARGAQHGATESAAFGGVKKLKICGTCGAPNVFKIYNIY